LSFYNNDKTFVLIGYSFGSLLALKIAHKLESMDKIGKLILIDGAPSYLSKITKNLLPVNFTENDVQTLIFIGVCKRIFEKNFKDALKQVLFKSSWNDRLDKFIEMASELSNYNVEFGRKMMTTMYNRVKMLANSEKNTFAKLGTTRVELVKPTEAATSDIDEDYELSKIVQQKISIHVMEGDHSSMLTNSKLIQYFNSFSKLHNGDA